MESKETLIGSSARGPIIHFGSILFQEATHQIWGNTRGSSIILRLLTTHSQNGAGKKAHSASNIFQIG